MKGTCSLGKRNEQKKKSSWKMVAGEVHKPACVSPDIAEQYRGFHVGDVVMFS